ncbi:MAG: DPP IV N-terminal domain-containing protein [Acidobacteria bacterium]|nr:DPP IV N-terminal domain-containing protein [Acidobacteriota bacterium]
MRRSAVRPITLLAVLLLVASAFGAETATKKRVTLERTHSEPPIVPRGASQFKWLSPTRLTYLLPESGGAPTPGTGPGVTAIWEYDLTTKKRTRLVGPASGAPPMPLRDAQWMPGGRSLLLKMSTDLGLMDVATRNVKKLTNDEAEEEYPTFSPSGSHVAFVKGNDLYAVEIATGKEIRLTEDGSEAILNGKLDWLYEEELANRKSGRSFEWSPDGRAIAFLRLDQSGVPKYPITDYAQKGGGLEWQRYPRAGDPNPVPSVHIVELPGAGPATSTRVTFDGQDVYVGPELSWTQDSKAVAYVKMNRAQTEISVNLLPRTGTSRNLLVEQDAAWINSLEPPTFLKDGSFLFLSERTGYLHLYRHEKDGKPRSAVTVGGWVIDGETALDEKAGVFYFVATEKDPRERHIYRVKLDGSGQTRLSQARGTHKPTFSPDFRHYVDVYSDIVTPPKAALFDANGKLVEMLDEPKNDLASYALASVELGSFTTEKGTFYTRLVKPADFDPAKKYPVVVMVYGGPHAQTVKDEWGRVSGLEQVMAANGILTWSMDNRGSGGRGKAWEAPLLSNMGATEVADQLEGITQLRKLPFVDGSRLGVRGWSYGGYMTLLLATKAGGLFKGAAAGAPVTSWTLYDSCYTERYMKLPADKEAEYERTAPLTSAASLGTKLLILHGTKDDNVHMQNTMQYLDALAKAKKAQVTFVPLLNQRHGPSTPAARRYADQRQLEFFSEVFGIPVE